MAQQRHSPNLPAGSTHALSLKVLRLSRPSLATQTPLPPTTSSSSSGLDIAPSASLAYPSTDHASTFPLTPLLTLPAAFGAAYVGETFVCTLCVNQEAEGEVSGTSVVAELQTPGNQAGTTLELDGEAGGQQTLRHELKEEGPHVLAITVTYTEVPAGRTRSFRKLYQFVAQQLIAVRSKVTERVAKQGQGRRWVLEAQLENVGDCSAVLERVWLHEREGVRSRAVHGTVREAVVLKPQDVEQVMFALEEEKRADDIVGRVPLGQLHVEWRSAMGERGSLATGWLASRAR